MPGLDDLKPRFTSGSLIVPHPNLSAAASRPGEPGGRRAASTCWRAASVVGGSVLTRAYCCVRTRAQPPGVSASVPAGVFKTVMLAFEGGFTHAVSFGFGRSPS